MKSFANFLAVCALVLAIVGCTSESPVQNTQDSAGSPDSSVPIPVPGTANVYFTADISPAGLMAVYEALDLEASGKVAVKVSTGDPPASNYLRQDLIGGLVKSIDGTYVECMVAYGGQRAAAATSKQVAADHGFAPFELLDEKGAIELPTPATSRNIKEDIVGAGISNYDFLVVLSHFKGHAMGGFGGAIKNLSIGFATREGKPWIHSAGTSKTNAFAEFQNPSLHPLFLESMAEAAGAVMNHFGSDKTIYINVMNRLSVDCDCNGNPAEPDMHDIGILASLDPVALDKACVDLVYDAPDGASLIARMEQQNGIHALDHAAAIGIGSLEYELVKLN